MFQRMRSSQRGQERGDKVQSAKSDECVVGRDVGGGAQNKKKLMLGQGLPTEKGLSNEAGILIS